MCPAARVSSLNKCNPLHLTHACLISQESAVFFYVPLSLNRSFRTKVSVTFNIPNAPYVADDLWLHRWYLTATWELLSDIADI